jgi:glutamine amidotransferase
VRITIADYGAGNLHSLTKALEGPNISVEVVTDPRAAMNTDALVLPGVGAFGHAARWLAPARTEMRSALDDGLPCIGICLGMQLLFDESEEGLGRGLGLIEGVVTRLDARRVPQIGWNDIETTNDPLFARAPLSVAYYANGYACRPVDDTVTRAWTTHDGDRFPAVVRSKRTIGVQFHPEKSSREGVAFLRAAVEEVVR